VRVLGLLWDLTVLCSGVTALVSSWPERARTGWVRRPRAKRAVPSRRATPRSPGAGAQRPPPSRPHRPHPPTTEKARPHVAHCALGRLRSRRSSQGVTGPSRASTSAPTVTPGP
jgi:hypothetical protein